jgi:glutathione synthase/RimK-type ligase-like ATP-grasp enzyme
MILLIGPLINSQFAGLCSRMLATGADEVLVLDPRHHPEHLAVTWTLQHGSIDGQIRYGSRIVPLSDVRAMFIDRLILPRAAGEGDSAGARARRDDQFHLLAAFANTAPAAVINRPANGMSNCSKPYQQQIIRDAGFRVPRTLVTTVPEAAVAFHDECNGRVIFKSISAHRSIVQRVTADDLARLDQVRCCPTQFQEYIPGVELRVHVVGERVFATEIMSPAADYRYAGRESTWRTMHPVDLPADIEARCLRLTAELGLVLAGIDLRRTPAGAYFCFEVNPAPGYSFFQRATGQKINEAVADLLHRCNEGGRDARPTGATVSPAIHSWGAP